MLPQNYGFTEVLVANLLLAFRLATPVVPSCDFTLSCMDDFPLIRHNRIVQTSRACFLMRWEKTRRGFASFARRCVLVVWIEKLTTHLM